MVDVSVIIPVFNTEKYLDRCLDSVLGQTLRDIEVLCVDDLSTDGTPALLERRAAADSRLKVLRMDQNGGPGKARNRALDAAEGRYVCFLDSDDWVEPDFLEKMYSAAEETGRPVVINACFVKEYDDPGKKEYSTRFGFLRDEPGDYPTAMVQLLFPPVLWARIYDRKYLDANKIRFPDLRGGGEDNYFTTLAEIPLPELYVFPGPYYHYYQRENSLAHLRSAGFDFILSFKALWDELRRRNLPTEDLRLFYAGPLVLDSAEKFDFVRSFLLEIKDPVLRHPERYIALDLYLLEAVTSASDHQDYLSRHNPNISIDFIRNRLRTAPKP